MAEYSNKVHAMVKSLRWKYREDKEANNALQRIIDKSMGVVYPDYLIESRRVQQLWEKNSARRKRIFRYVRGMVRTFPKLYLVSLTFSDDVLFSTSQATRKRYISDWLNANTLDYYACIDFGRKTHREHYHALCAFDVPFKNVLYGKKTFCEPLNKCKQEWYSYGFYSIREVELEGSSFYKTANYAIKASTYAFKTASVDCSVKPFHKRGVVHSTTDWVSLESDDELPF